MQTVKVFPGDVILTRAHKLGMTSGQRPVFNERDEVIDKDHWVVHRDGTWSDHILTRQEPAHRRSK